MAEEHKEQVLNVEGGAGEGEVRDRGLFDFARKKEAAEEKKPQEKEEVLVTGVEKVHIEEGHKAEKEKEEEKKHGLLEKLHRSHSTSSSSSSSSDEEEEVEGEGGIKQKIKKKKEKKSLKEKMDEKLHRGEKKEEKEGKEAPATVEETITVAEKVDVFEEAALPPEVEKKGLLDKIKEKLPGHSKKAAEEGGAASHPAAIPVKVVAEHVKEEDVAVEGTEGKEKKGFLGKIMEKLPGYHHKNAGEEAEKSPASH